MHFREEIERCILLLWNFTPCACEDPCYQISIDYIGPIPTSANGNWYILTISDYFTKWVEGVPLPTEHALITAGTLFKESSILLILHHSLILCLDNCTSADIYENRSAQICDE